MKTNLFAQTRGSFMQEIKWYFVR